MNIKCSNDSVPYKLIFLYALKVEENYWFLSSFFTSPQNKQAYGQSEAHDQFHFVSVKSLKSVPNGKGSDWSLHNQQKLPNH